MNKRIAQIERKTAETDIKLTLDLDGTGKSDVSTLCPFLDHMLTLFAHHGRFDLSLTCRGDTEVDYHHTTEDVGIALGSAVAQALGDKRGICRYGDITLAMDEALVLCSVDISGRMYLGYALDIPAEQVGDFDCELTEEFYLGFCRAAGITLHLRQLCGKNSHHIIECSIKAFGRALSRAVAVDPRLADEIPSTKGVL